MSSHPKNFARHFQSLPMVAIFRTKAACDLLPAVEAVARGGIVCQEITLNTPGALEQIARIRGTLGAGIALGAGTVLDADDCRAAIGAGAEFIVTPTLQPDSIAVCNERGVPIFCGAYTPTEALAAHRAGANFVKIFPADALGPPGVRAILAPLPFLRIVPTGGVTEATIPAFHAAGCAGLAVGGSLFREEDAVAKDWPSLEARTRSLADTYRETRRQS